MTYRDRVKQTTTTTGTGAITLGSASAGYRAIADAYSVSDLVPYCIESQAPGEWEVGIGTLTAPTTLARTTVTASSNAGALVNFSAGTKNVFGTATANQLRSGLVDPSDVGYDIILCAGQSNMAGRGIYDASVDLTSERIMQFGGFNGDARYRTIFTGSDPLHPIEGINTAKVGPATHAARAYCSARPSNRRVLLVPTAQGGTTLVALTPGWGPSGTLRSNAISQANLAITAAIALYPNSRFVGTLWHQGESDGDNNVSQVNYTAALKALIADFRASITGASASWFVIGGMTPEGIAGAGGTRAAINSAHSQVATETSKCAFVAGPSGMGDTNHYTAAGVRILGARMGVAIETARNYFTSDTTAPTASSAVVQNATSTSVDVDMSEPMDTTYTPASSAFTVSGHTVSAAAWFSSTALRLTVNAFVNGEAASTAAYTQPGANNARDAAGNLLANFSGLAITNNVAAVDVTAPVLTSPTGAQTGTTTATVGATTNEATGTLYALVSVNATETAATVKASGTTQAITTTGAKTVNATGLTASTLYYGHLVHRDAAGNDSTVATSASFTTAASATAPAQMAAPTATGGNATASVVMVAPANGGSAITGYTVTSSPAGGVDSNAGTTSLTHTITGLTNGTAYTFTATATNAIGTSAASPASNSVTPAAPAVFATWNPADKESSVILSNGNMTAAGPTGSPAGWLSVRSTVSKTAGKWYWETTVGNVPTLLGVANSTAPLTNFVGADGNGVGYYNTGNLYRNGSSVGAPAVATYVAGDVIGFALDMDAKTITVFKNNVQQGPVVTALVGTAIFAMATVKAGSPPGSFTTNFGASSFAYTPPSGHAGLA